MATSSSNKPGDKGKPGVDIGVYVSNFLPGQCPPGVIDPRVLFCDTDGGCEWAEICEDEDLVCINGTWYYTWRPKGIQDDFCENPKDVGIHVHLSCNVDQTGIRLTGDDIVTVFEELCDPDIIARFCDWLFDNCLSTTQYMDWVCDTIVNHCFPDPTFLQAFCQWFIDSVLTQQKFIDAFTQWLLDNIFNNPTIIDALCNIVETCINTDTDVRDAICVVVEDCLQNSVPVRDEICEIVDECLDDTDTQDIICDIVKNYCQTADTWNSSTDPDPVGTPANDWYMIDTVTGCVTHVCIAGVWVCLGAPSS